MKKLTALLLTAVLVLSLSACGQKAEQKSKIDQIKEAGVLVMGTSADYPPNEFHTEIDGVDTIVGFDIDLGQYVADKLGVDLKVVDMSFDSLCISLSEGDFDMVIAGMSATPERLKAVDFTNSHFTTGQLVVIRAEDAETYTTTADLAGHKVGVQNGTVQVPLANEIAGEENVVGLVKAQDIIMELKAGKIDAAFVDYMPALAYAAADDSLVAQDIGIVYDSEGQAIAVQKGNEDFVEFLNDVIAEVQENGQMEQWIADAQLLAGIEGE